MVESDASHIELKWDELHPASAITKPLVSECWTGNIGVFGAMKSSKFAVSHPKPLEWLQSQPSFDRKKQVPCSSGYAIAKHDGARPGLADRVEIRGCMRQSRCRAMPNMARLRGVLQLVRACQAQFAVPLDIVLGGRGWCITPAEKDMKPYDFGVVFSPPSFSCEIAELLLFFLSAFKPLQGLITLRYRVSMRLDICARTVNHGLSWGTVRA